jgi:hypothetical protein
MVLPEGQGKWLPAASIKGLLPAVAAPALTTPPVATLVGSTPRGGSDAPTAIPLNGEILPDYRPRSKGRRGLWPWVAGAAAALLAMAGIAVGVLAWTGFFASDEPTASPRPKMDLSYIAAEFNGAVVIHPRRILKSPVLGKPVLEEKIDKMVHETGIDPRKVDQVMVLIEPLIPEGALPRAAPPKVVFFSLGGIIRFSEAVDGYAILHKNLGETETRWHAGKRYVLNLANKLMGGNLAGYVADERTLVVGFEPTLLKMLSARGAASPLRERLARLDLNRDVTGLIFPEPYLKLVSPLLSTAAKSLPPDLANLSKLSTMVKAATLTADLSGPKLLEVSLEADSADSAAALKKMADIGFNLVKGFYPFARPRLTEGVPPEDAAILLAIADQINSTDGVTIRQDGTAMVLTLKRPETLSAPAGVAVAAAGDQGGGQLDQAAAHSQVARNMKTLALAMHTYHDANKGLPMPALTDSQGRSLLSWRVAILPMLDELELYQQFKLDEPWNSPHNYKLLPRMPKIFAPVVDKPSDPYSTFYHVFVGGGAAFEPGKRLGFGSFPDGLSNTILIVDGAQAVPWTVPSALPYHPQGLLPRLGGHFPGGFHVALADGTVRFFKQNCDPQELRAAITRAGGETVRFEKLEQ